jgi:probable phosphoglycerate mutase
MAAFMRFPFVDGCGTGRVRVTPNLPRYLPAVTRILLVRHGQSVWNADGRWQGQADPPLSDVGVDQAAAAADSDVVDGVRALYSSDLERARHTAQLLGVRLSLTPVVDERLRERHAGEWEGCTRVEIDAGWPGYLESGRRPPGYEPDDSVLARVLDALGAIATAHAGDVLVVTHGGVVRTVERHLGGAADGLIPNLGGRWLHHDGTALRLGDRVVLLHPDQVTRPQQI